MKCPDSSNICLTFSVTYILPLNFWCLRFALLILLWIVNTIIDISYIITLVFFKDAFLNGEINTCTQYTYNGVCMQYELLWNTTLTIKNVQVPKSKQENLNVDRI